MMFSLRQEHFYLYEAIWNVKKKTTPPPTPPNCNLFFDVACFCPCTNIMCLPTQSGKICVCWATMDFRLNFFFNLEFGQNRCCEICLKATLWMNYRWIILIKTRVSTSYFWWTTGSTAAARGTNCDWEKIMYTVSFWVDSGVRLYSQPGLTMSSFKLCLSYLLTTGQWCKVNVTPGVLHQ